MNMKYHSIDIQIKNIYTLISLKLNYIPYKNTYMLISKIH